IDKAPAETGRPLAPNPVKQASKHQDFDKFVNALEAAVQAANNGNLFSFTLLERLDQIFPGGNLNHALFLVDLMLLTPECYTLDSLLWADFKHIADQRHKGTKKKPAYNCSRLHTLCLTEIFSLKEDLWESNIFSLFEHCIRMVVT